MSTKISTGGFYDLHFPKSGLDVSQPLSQQPARAMANKQYGRTTPEGINVRTYEPAGNRDRGGSRPGFVKYIAQALDEGWVVQCLGVVSTIGGTPVQTSNSGRVVNILGVSKGVVKIAQPGDDTWTATVNGTSDVPPLNYDGLVFYANLNQKTFFGDGINAKYWDSADNTVKDWTPTAGTLPIDDDMNRHRLLCTWRGRMVLSGVRGDPQNWFMSRKDDPFDWEYGADNNDVMQAVAGNNSPAGTVGDTINSMVPYNDDVLLFGGDSTLWLMNGDPLYGGQIDRISDAVGMAFGNPWCKDPFGAVYFFSSRNSIFRLVPGQQLTRISGPIQRLIDDVDTGNNSIHMQWDERQQGFGVYITPLQRDAQNRPKVTRHLFWESRSGAWWQDEFVNTSHNPLCSAVLDGNNPEDRVVILGGWDGFVRSIDRDAETDDGKKITSSVVLGPFLTATLDEMTVRDLQAVLATASGEVEYEILVGDTAEEALTLGPVDTGVWEAGRNPTTLVNRSAHALYIRLKSTNRWAMESVRANIETRGRVRGRGRAKSG